MPDMTHPDLPGRTITVSSKPGAIAARVRSGWSVTDSTSAPAAVVHADDADSSADTDVQED